MTARADGLLALDTTGGACSAALLVGGQILYRESLTPREHSRRLLGMVDDLLGEAGVSLQALDAIAFGAGPGSFTGVRIATGVAQGLAFGAGLALVPVSSLAVLAQGQLRAGAAPGLGIVSCFDARMGELYWGAYIAGEDGLVRATRPDALDRPDALVRRALADRTGEVPGASGWVGAGSGFAACPGIVERLSLRRVDVEAQPLARDAVPLAVRALSEGAAVAPGDVVPAYLRNSVAEPPAR